MNWIALAVVVAGGLVGGAILVSSGSFKPETQQPFEAALRDHFVDPASVQIRKVIKDNSLDKWCGEVNAKNRMGGYNGWDRFIAISDTVGGWTIYTETEVGHFSTWCA